MRDDGLMVKRETPPPVAEGEIWRRPGVTAGEPLPCGTSVRRPGCAACGFHYPRAAWGFDHCPLYEYCAHCGDEKDPCEVTEEAAWWTTYHK